MSAREVEIKFHVAPADRHRLERLLADRQPACERQHLVAIYFDTPARALRKLGYTLRVRNRGQHHVQTIKAEEADSAGLFARREWERAVPGEQPLLDGDEPLSALIGGDELNRLSPAFATDVERATCMISLTGAEVEAALDVGQVGNGARSETLCELELELKQGSPRGLFDLARQLDGEVPLRLEVRSKAERGHRLLGRASRGAAKAEPARLDRHMRASDAFVRIATHCLRHYRINEARLLEAITPEDVHQARVALRRLRTAIGLFKPLFKGDERAALLSSEVRRLAQALGDLRNLDVLIERMDAQVPGTVRAAREAAVEHARAELHSSRPRLLMLDLVEWLTIGAWREQPDDRDLAEDAIAGFAAHALARAHKRFRRAADDLSSTDEEGCHRARIAAKKLRYAAEFFGEFCTTPRDRRRLKDWLRALKAVQDDLGALNDMAVGGRILAGLGEDMPVPAPDAASLQKNAAKHGAALADAKLFWRDWAEADAR